jgi:DNA polymerase-1
MIMIIDGHSVAYRAYYAVPPLVNKKGIPTGVIHTFLNILLNLKEKYKPDKIFVTFDSKGKTRQHKILDSYKANRQATPEDLIPQVEYLKQIIPLLGIPVLAEVGFEADDIIYTLTQKFDDDILIVTKDKDLHQLVSDRIKIIDYKKENPVDYDDVVEKFGVTPEQILDYLALTGDTSDNIPGVKGIGPKTAVKLLNEYKTLDNIFKNTDNLKGAVKKKIENSKEVAYLSKELATLENMENLEIDYPQENLKKLEEIINELELKSIQNRIFSKSEQTKPKSLKSGNVEDTKLLTFIDNQLIKADFEHYAITQVIPANTDYYFDYKNILKISGNFDKKALDIMLISWMNDPDTGGLKKLKDESIGEFLSKVLNEAQNEVNKLKENNLSDIYFETEIKMLYCLSKMELNGIKFSPEIIHKVEEKLKLQIEKIEKEILDELGENINLNSTKQLAEVLFDKMSLKPFKKTKTGYSTSEEALEGVIILNPEYEPLIRKILLFRELRKLLSTYTSSLAEYINKKTGRIHSDFRQTGTATGRLSSNNPNLQNLPQKGEIAKEIRSAFITEKGYKFISFDYSQIELRILAHLSQDDNLLNAYKEDLDIHNITAKNILNLNDEEITPEIRRIAKAVNFGILYGLSPFGLARDTGVNQNTAKEFIKSYYELYPKVKNYFNDLIEKARQTGYTETILGRKRFFKELNSKNFNLRQRAERMVMNAPIQGSAADIIKLAMIESQNYIEKNNIDAKIVLQIHDELIFEVNEKIVDKLFYDIKDIMENIFNLSVPLKVNGNIGNNLGELK